MPLYPYRCTECGHKFEKIQSFSSEPEKECPKCHGVLERPLTVPGFNFKGAGWYVNDYAPKSGGSSSDSAKTETKAEPKTDTKSDTNSGPKTETKASGGDTAGASAPSTAATPAATS